MNEMCVMRCSTEMPNISYAWKELRATGWGYWFKVKEMVFLKGKQGVCFDIQTASVTEVQEKWHDSWHWQLSVAMEQPELERPWEGDGNFGEQGEGNPGFREQSAKESGDSRKEAEASVDSDQEVARKVTDWNKSQKQSSNNALGL